MNLPHPLTLSVKSSLGSGQSRINFCSSQERARLGQGGYSKPLHNISRGWGKGLSPKQKGQINMAENHPLLSFIGLEDSCEKLLFCTLWHWYCCSYCLFSYVVAVFSKMFLPQRTVITFCLSVPCSGAIRVEGRRGAVCCFSEFAKLENTVSKSQHKLLSKCTRCLFQNAWKKNIAVQVNRDEKSSY